jgi:hypothetical protein
MSDTIRITFADTDGGKTTHTIVVDGGQGDATVAEIIERKGAYATGWVASDDRRWWNLGAAVSISLSRESDPVISPTLA